jgi:Predicted metal-binding integral membrane protein (DUF2182)
MMWRHAEWWSLGLSLAAWAVLIVGGSPQPAHHHGAPIARAWQYEVGHWLLMVTAMMVPLVLSPIRMTAARSLWRRRHRAIAAFLVGYLLPWTIGGLVAATFITFAPETWRHPPLAVGVAFAIAAAWQIAPAKRRSLVACHRAAPIAPDGWRATCDCVRYGSTIGTSCVVSCFPLMLVCIAARHHVSAMAAVAIVGAGERLSPLANQRATSAVLAALAIISFVVGAYGLTSPTGS